MCIKPKEDYTSYLPRKRNSQKIDWRLVLNYNCKSNSEGVYAFMYEDEIIYVGKTHNLSERIKNHFTSDNLAFSKFLCMNYQKIKVFLLYNKNKFEVESQYIHLLRPKFNRTI